jgi:phosphonate transport system ATP-binding protein
VHTFRIVSSEAAAAERPVVLRLREVSKRFPMAVALDRVSIKLRAGELVALVGPSGAGKSTLFRCVTRLEPPDDGRIELDGQDVTRLSAKELREVRQTIGLVFQQFNLIGRLSALDNVLVGRLGSAATWRVLAHRFTPADRQAALTALDHVGLLDKAYQRADKLSGGQQQRVAIARVLAQEAEIILADEPVSSLDPGSANAVLEVLKRIARDYGKAILCSLHQTDLARRYADRIIGLREGRLCFDARPEELTEERLMAHYS